MVELKKIAETNYGGLIEYLAANPSLTKSIL